MARTATLQEINPDKIRANPDNPRIVFREDEMQQLMDSIKEVGIKVPLSLYADGAKFVLLDGERRWRCGKRLNLRLIPGIVQPKPNRLENILMMFNIHNVRVDWDPMPMALKLRDVQELLAKEGKANNAKALAAVTGVRRNMPIALPLAAGDRTQPTRPVEIHPRHGQRSETNALAPRHHGHGSTWMSG
jgi:ParB family chromosome partitioning protein